MSCKYCDKNITGNFICFNIGAGILDDTESSAELPKGLKLEYWFELTCHSKKINKSISLFEKNYTNEWSEQFEEYFCSKECLINWFSEQIKNLPNP